MKWYEKQKKLYDQNQKEIVGSEGKTLTSQEKEAAVEQTVKKEQLMKKEIQVKAAQPQTASAAPLADSRPVSKETTVIQHNTTIQGDMNSDDNITIHGTLIGNIHCGGNLIVSGSVKGNVTCQNVVLQRAEIEGDIQCEQHMEISEETTVKGNIRVCDIICSGQVKGDTLVSENAKFMSTSCVIGDVQTQVLEIESGAVLQGNLLLQPVKRKEINS